ncbi:hypothetical protein FisN_18Lh136 [Fistulifera solaris]|uniref:HD/PDEase domain-containing protein n=1 Tax=Fistulifera solaris TaxID=1519565 RepID=A0A1Z5KF01_FISSO|nr:hypothetical protein FisN_18Lh136 [Fistulifera solaris]|eukprot:GAX24786.1 hypothetical protein FisN_18Lh136 [Fistulifera solaris]
MDMLQRVQFELESFYLNNPHIPESHGFCHAMAVFQHAARAVKVCSPPISCTSAIQVQIAALLHDVDDEKYFPNNRFLHTKTLLQKAQVPPEYWDRILFMIQQVSCSKNGNRIPDSIREDYYYLIPRWADRIEAVGLQGVWRCFQYTREQQRTLWSSHTPRPQTPEEVWALATRERFQAYQDRGGTSEDMISHYYDKLLHIARPPADLIRNSYLENQFRDASQILVDICLLFGKEGKIDESSLLERMPRSREWRAHDGGYGPGMRQERPTV